MLAGLSGSAESLGLENQSLIDLLSLRLRNDVSSVPLCGDIYDEGLTWVFLSVTGVGNDFPVAFYVELRVSVSTEDVFESATLGYGSKTSVEEQVEESVRDLVESFGIAFLKGRGEWWSR
jgi:hypothetical protein